MQLPRLLRLLRLAVQDETAIRRRRPAVLVGTLAKLIEHFEATKRHRAAVFDVRSMITTSCNCWIGESFYIFLLIIILQSSIVMSGLDSCSVGLFTWRRAVKMGDVSFPGASFLSCDSTSEPLRPARRGLVGWFHIDRLRHRPAATSRDPRFRDSV